LELELAIQGINTTIYFMELSNEHPPRVVLHSAQGEFLNYVGLSY
jgi:hypothetical protein